MRDAHMSQLQQRIYDFIGNHIGSKGRPPTIREIGHAVQITSTGHIAHHLTMLEKKGLIVRESKKSRGMQLVASQSGIPLKGMIAAGAPLDIYPNVSQRLDVGGSFAQGKPVYALLVRGQSMIEDYICDGDYIVIQPGSVCRNGDIVVATHMQEGEHGSATLKRFYFERGQNRVRLQPANAQMDPIFIPKSTWDREWSVQGTVVAVVRQYQPSS
ncbi:MAG: repressor LexA [Ktedonobacteraceae bacterium]|nr:repressor LexA [Ktedonobacteraceae bacterium]